MGAIKYTFSSLYGSWGWVGSLLLTAAALHNCWSEPNCSDSAPTATFLAFASISTFLVHIGSHWFGPFLLHAITGNGAKESLSSKAATARL